MPEVRKCLGLSGRANDRKPTWGQDKSSDDEDAKAPVAPLSLFPHIHNLDAVMYSLSNQHSILIFQAYGLIQGSRTSTRHSIFQSLVYINGGFTPDIKCSDDKHIFLEYAAVLQCPFGDDRAQSSVAHATLRRQLGTDRSLEAPSLRTGESSIHLVCF
jgi:hypothetical protein